MDVYFLDLTQCVCAYLMRVWSFPKIMRELFPSGILKIITKIL